MRRKRESTAVLDSLRPAKFCTFPAPAQVSSLGVAARNIYPSHNQDDFGTTLNATKIALWTTLDATSLNTSYCLKIINGSKRI